MLKNVYNELICTPMTLNVRPGVKKREPFREFYNYLDLFEVKPFQFTESHNKNVR